MQLARLGQLDIGPNNVLNHDMTTSCDQICYGVYVAIQQNHVEKVNKKPSLPFHTLFLKMNMIQDTDHSK